MTDLRKLAMRYVEGEIDFPTFRRAFVVDFLTTESTVPSVQMAVGSIESESADFSEGMLTEDLLKSRLKEIVKANCASRQQAVELSSSSFQSMGSTVITNMLTLVGSANASVPIEPNVKWLTEAQWILAAPVDKESSVVFASTTPLR